MPPLPRVLAKHLCGTEAIHHSGKRLDPTVADFWRWLASDLLNNTIRGRLAEWLVAVDLCVADTLQRDWEAHDLTTKEGNRVEVKSAAYIQSWHQKKPSSIVFSIAEKGIWDPETGNVDSYRCRQCDVFVFCVLGKPEQAEVDPLDLDHWRFIIVATADLDRVLGRQKTVSLSRLRQLPRQECHHGEIAAGIVAVLAECHSR